MDTKVNEKLLPMKGHYFLFNAATSPVVPFMPTLARQLGYSTVIVGVIYTVLPVVGMIAKPLFGMIADKFQRQKFLFLLFQLLVMVAFFGINFIPPIPANSELHSHQGAIDLKFCPPNIQQIDNCTLYKVLEDTSKSTFGCSMKCHPTPVNWDVICGYWNVSGLCDSKGSSFDIYANIQRDQVQRVKDCFFLGFNHATINNQNTTMFSPTEPQFNMTCDVECEDDTINEILAGATDDQVKSTYQFWLFFCFLIISWAGMAVVVSVGDAICFEMLGDKPQRYGNQRMWGSIGWGTFSIISGILIDKFSEGKATKNYAIGFYMMAVLILLDMLVSSKLKYSQTKLSKNFWADVGQIFSSCRVLIFFLWCIVVGLGTAMIWNFLFWHLENLAAAQEGCDKLSSIKTLQGLVMGIQCFGGELPFFFLSGWLLKKIGHVNAMSLVLLGFAVRFFCYSLLTNPWWVLPIELLNGVTFGVFYSTMASYASILAPPGTEATIQGLVGAVFEGIGVSMGSLIGGLLMQNIGGSATFKLFSILHYFTGVDSKIKHFSLNLKREDPFEDLAPIRKFLSMQIKLQDFSSLGNGFAYNNTSTMEEFGKCQYELKKLSFSRTIKHRMLDHCYPHELNEDNMLEFLRTQSESVEQLDLVRTFTIPIYRSILMNFKNLKSINFQMDGFPVENIAPIFRCKPILGVKDLVLSGNLNYDACKGIFSVFPNVEKLVIDNSAPIDNIIMLLMTTMLLKVDSLHISKVDDLIFKDCKFGALKTLQMHEVKNLSHIGLTRLTKCNPSIETLSIKLMDSEFNLIFDIITRNLKNLKVLKLGRGFYPTLKVAKAINKCQNIRVLKMPDYYANDNETTCNSMQLMNFCRKKDDCKECLSYTVSNWSYNRAKTFSAHIDHNKLMLVTFNLSKLSFNSEFSIDNILECGNYEDEKDDESDGNLKNDSHWCAWAANEE
ncbi:unnamed protein product [Diamesa hyperborea]